MDETDEFFCNPSLAFVERGGQLLEPDPKDPREKEGILNPSVAGNYLIYRAVAKGNFSRLMAARLTQTQSSSGHTIIKAEKLHQVVLEPTEDFEMTSTSLGGVEDPRITPLPDGTFVMFYTACNNPNILNQTPPAFVALATSYDGLQWKKKGRIIFDPLLYNGQEIDLNTIPNKDAVLFSEKINGKYAMFHRPMFTPEQAKQYGISWRSIWYAEADNLVGPWQNSRIVLNPEFDWEGGGVGAGIAPLHLKNFWVHLYHGFTQSNNTRVYSAGIFTTLHQEPTKISYRFRCPILQPEAMNEIVGTVSSVVFPTGAWPIKTLSDGIGIFWGAADAHIMWGLLRLPFIKEIPLIIPPLND